MRQLMHHAEDAEPTSSKDSAGLLQAGVREFEAQLALARAQGATPLADAAQFPNDGLLDLLDMVPFEDSTIPTSSLEPEETAHRSSKAALARDDSSFKPHQSEQPPAGSLVSSDITLTSPELPQISEADISQVLESLDNELQQLAASGGGCSSDLELELLHGVLDDELTLDELINVDFEDLDVPDDLDPDVDFLNLADVGSRSQRQEEDEVEKEVEELEETVEEYPEKAEREDEEDEAKEEKEEEEEEEEEKCKDIKPITKLRLKRKTSHEYVIESEPLLKKHLGLSPLEGTAIPHECQGEPCAQCLQKLRRYRGAGLHDLSSVFNSVVKKRERHEIRRVFEAFTTKRLSDLNLKKLQETERFSELGIDLINILRQFFGSMRTTENFVLNDPHMLAKINALMCCPRFRNDVNFHSYRYRFHLHDYATKKFLNLLMTTFCKEIGYHCAIYAALMNHKITSLDHLKAFIEVHDLADNPIFVDSEDSCFVKLNDVHRYIPAALQPSISKVSTFCYLSFLERILDGTGTTKDLVQKVCNNNDHMFRLATFCKIKFCPEFLKELQRMLLKFILILIRNIICSFEKRYAQRSDGKRRFPVMIEDIIECVREMKIDVLDEQLERYLEDRKCFERTYLTFRDIKQSYNNMNARNGEKRRSPGTRMLNQTRTKPQPVQL